MLRGYSENVKFERMFECGEIVGIVLRKGEGGERGGRGDRVGEGRIG